MQHSVEREPKQGPRLKALGRFRIEAALGGGSFGTVYRAFDPLVGEHVALKVLRPELARDGVQMERLRREVVLARKVDHPGVCRIHDLHQDGETLFVVMEHIDGETLDLLCAKGPLPPERATKIIEDVCRALTAAHDVGVLHRDIKPSNVMVRSKKDLAADGSVVVTDEVTLVDFGIATTQGLEHLTKPGVALGTVGYLAPELWDGHEATPLTDVFAAGVMLYGTLTLKMPWRATGLALAQQMRNVAPVPPSLFAPPAAPADAAQAAHPRRIDAALDNIVARAICVDPSRRFASAREFADALSAWRAGVEDAPAPAPSLPPAATAVDAMPRDTVRTPTSTRPRAALAALAALALLGAGAAALALTRPDDDDGARPSPPPPLATRAPLELTRPVEPPREDAAPAALEALEPLEDAAPAALEDDAPDVKDAARPRPRVDSDLARRMSAARAELTRAMKERGLVVGDVASADTALRSRVGGQRAVQNLEAALADVKAVDVDRAFVERKLARLQARAAASPSKDPRLDTLAAGIAADIAARRYGQANARLNQALALVR